MSETKIIRNREGRIIGKFDDSYLRDGNGRIVAKYDESVGMTRDRNGRIVGTGDIRISQLGK